MSEERERERERESTRRTQNRSHHSPPPPRRQIHGNSEVVHQNVMRHQCVPFADVCTFQNSLVTRSTGVGVKLPFRVRDPYQSHKRLPKDLYSPSTFKPAWFLNVTDTRAAPPLVWVPTWIDNFGEQMLNSMLPLYEMLGANRSKRRFILDTRRTVPIRDNILKLMAPFSVHPVQLLSRTHECFSHLTFCNFYSMSFSKPYKSNVWQAAQAVANFYSGPRALPPPLRARAPILIDVKTNRRRIRNMKSILEWCVRTYTEGECKSNDFSKTAFVESVELMRQTRILIGMHGAGLSNAHFMPRPNVLVEIRPYAFEGQWPDRYYRNVLNGESMHMHIGISEREDCTPTKPMDASAWQGWNTDCEVSVKAVAQAVRNARTFVTNPSAYANAPLPAKSLTSYVKAE